MNTVIKIHGAETSEKRTSVIKPASQSPAAILVSQKDQKAVSSVTEVTTALRRTAKIQTGAKTVAKRVVHLLNHLVAMMNVRVPINQIAATGSGQAVVAMTTRVPAATLANNTKPTFLTVSLETN